MSHRHSCALGHPSQVMGCAVQRHPARGVRKLSSTEHGNPYGFPEDWFFFNKTGENSGWGGVRCFQPPDPTQLPEATLKDHNLFKRLLLSLRDLGHARSAIAFIREDIDFEKGYPLAELRRFQCYETTLVVSYCRPFSQSVEQIPRLSYETLGIELSTFTRELHQGLMRKRNKIFAHSDAGEVEYSRPTIMHFKGREGHPFTIPLPPRFREGMLLDEGQVEQVSVLVSCLLSAVYKMIVAMHGNFAEHYPSMDFEGET